MIKDLYDQLEKFGFSRWYNEIEPLTRPAIRLKSRQVDEKELPLGSSKLGGSPDLPPNIEWPWYKDRPMAFLAQLRLDEVAPYDTESLLPSSGLLYFFYDIEQEPWGFDPAWRDGWKVVYEDDISQLTRTSHPAFTSIFPLSFNPCAIEFANEITLPSFESEEIQHLDFTDEERDNYFELTNAGIIHQLFGHPATIQGEMEGECQLVSNGINIEKGVDYSNSTIIELLKGASKWRLLFQLDSDQNPGFSWGEEGRLYFWIEKDALEARKFSKVWLVGQCS